MIQVKEWKKTSFCFSVLCGSSMLTCTTQKLGLVNVFWTLRGSQSFPTPCSVQSCHRNYARWPIGISKCAAAVGFKAQAFDGQEPLHPRPNHAAACVQCEPPLEFSDSGLTNLDCALGRCKKCPAYKRPFFETEATRNISWYVYKTLGHCSQHGALGFQHVCAECQKKKPNKRGKIGWMNFSVGRSYFFSKTRGKKSSRVDEFLATVESACFSAEKARFSSNFEICSCFPLWLQISPSEQYFVSM